MRTFCTVQGAAASGSRHQGLLLTRLPGTTRVPRCGATLTCPSAWVS